MMTLLRNIPFIFILITAALLCGAFLAFGAFYAVGYFEIYQNATMQAPVFPQSVRASEDSPGGVPIVENGFYYKPLVSRTPQIPPEGKYVLADLAGMTITLYENGSSTAQLPIISRGKEGTYFETPTGEYRVSTKEENHFSSIGKVWMPYSVGFFGNFFIHGWPYYPSGEPVPLGYSGGCLRLKDSDAKVVYDFVDRNTPIVITEDAPSTIGERGYIPLLQQNPPHISAEAFLVADLDNKNVFLEKNRSATHPIASITKLMTAIISVEAINQFREVTLTPEDIEVHGDSGNLKAGETYAVKDLMAPLLLSSSNDAAYVLSRIIGTNHFISLMNKKAGALGLASTQFTDPSGLQQSNISTPDDLLGLLRYIRDVRAPILTTSAKKAVTVKTDRAAHTWYNFNWKSGDGTFVGGKVGYLSSAGHTMVALFRLPMSEFTTRDIGVVVLGSRDREGDVKKLVNWVRSNFVYGSTVEKNVPGRSPFGFNTGSKNLQQPYSMLFVGDIMMDRGIRTVVEKYGSGDYAYPFEKVRQLLSDADLSFGNLEGPVSDQGEKRGSIYSFRMDPAVTKALYDAGIDIVSVANNHMGDYGRDALEDTLRRLRRAGIAYTGAGWDNNEAQGVTIIERAGQKIGFLGFSDIGPAWIEAGEAVSGISLASVAKVTEAVRQANANVDILVVSYHFGEEYETHSRARQQELARAAIDAGADIVIGHHPHVAQEVEQYKGGVIAYSLGNFIFDQAFSDDTKKALALKLFMKGKRIERFEEIPITFNERFQPEFRLP